MGVPPQGREATTGNGSAVRRLNLVLIKDKSNDWINELLSERD